MSMSQSSQPLNQQCGFHVKEFAGGVGVSDRDDGMTTTAPQFPVQQSALSFGTVVSPQTKTTPTLNIPTASKTVSKTSKLYRISGNTKARLAPSSMSPGLAMSQGDMTLAEHSHLTPGVKKMMRSVVRGLKAYQEPEAATEGLGGTYFFKSETGSKIAIMKPCDEEPMAPSNPKGFRGRQLGEPGLKPTVRVGEAASREVAAYLLDHDGRAGVPHTVMVRMAHPIFHYDDDIEEGVGDVSGVGGLDGSDVLGGGMVAKENVDDIAEEGIFLKDADESAELPLKLGSLQSFVRHECDTTEMGSKLFHKKDVHRIGILDIRLFNTDRHGGNILVQKVAGGGGSGGGGGGFGIGGSMTGFHIHHPTVQYKLVPIDHGFALPEGLEPPYYEWQHWPQAMLPFDKEELEYIASLDAKADVDLLRKELPDIHEASFRVLELSTLLLQKAAAAGLTLSEIAGVLTRPICIDEEPSELEKMCFEIRQEMHRAEMSVLRRGNSQQTPSINLAADRLSLVAIDDDGHDDIELDVFDDCSHKTNSNAAANSTTFSSPQGTNSALTSYLSMNMEYNGSDEYHDQSPTSETKILRKQTDSDVLFSMDEDGGSKTPAPSSPAQNIRSKEGMYIEAPTLRVKPTGEVDHMNTPFGTTFKSVLGGATGSSPSYDSESPTHHNDSDTIPEDEVVSGFGVGVPYRGAQSYVPTMMKFPATAMASHREIKERTVGPGGMKTTSTTDASLQEPRGCHEPSFVFKDMTERQWSVFMAKANEKITEKLASGAWIDSFGSHQMAQMSCPV